MAEILSKHDRIELVQEVLSDIITRINSGETISTSEIKDALEERGLSRRSINSITEPLNARVRDVKDIVKEHRGLSRAYRKIR